MPRLKWFKLRDDFWINDGNANSNIYLALTITMPKDFLCQAAEKFRQCRKSSDSLGKVQTLIAIATSFTIFIKNQFGHSKIF
jgi:hypothetical protein